MVMNQGIKTIIYSLKDLAHARALFSKLLGIEPYMDGAHPKNRQDNRIDRIDFWQFIRQSCYPVHLLDGLVPVQSINYFFFKVSIYNCMAFHDNFIK